MNINTKKPISGFSRNTVVATLVCIALLAAGWYSYQNWFKDTRTADEKKLASYRLEIVNTLSQVSTNTPVEVELAIKSQDGTKLADWDSIRRSGEYMRLVVAYHRASSIVAYYPVFDATTQTFRVTLNFPQPGSAVLFADVIPDTGLFSSAPVVHTSLALIVSGQAAAPPANENSANGGYSATLADSWSFPSGKPTTLHWVLRKGQETVEADKEDGVYGRLSIVKQNGMEYTSYALDTSDLQVTHTFPDSGIYEMFLETQVDDQVVTTIQFVSVGGSQGQ